MQSICCRECKQKKKTVKLFSKFGYPTKKRFGYKRVLRKRMSGVQWRPAESKGRGHHACDGQRYQRCCFCRCPRLVAHPGPSEKPKDTPHLRAPPSQMSIAPRTSAPRPALALRQKFSLFSRSVVSDYLWPHGLQYTRFPCPSLSPGVSSNSCPLTQQ